MSASKKSKTKRKTKKKVSGSKKPARKKTAKKITTKKKASKKKQSTSSLKEISKRLGWIEANINSIQSSAFNLRILEVDAPTVDVKFKKTSGPDLVRLTIETTEVISPTQKGGSYSAAVGEYLTLKLEVVGNEGDEAVVTIDNAIPNKMTLKIRPNHNNEKGTMPIYVTG